MKPEVKARWIEALRSGQYRQTSGLLRRNVPPADGGVQHCCLGVLCDLYDPTRWEKEESASYSVYDSFGIYGLTPTVEGWADFSDSYIFTKEHIPEEILQLIKERNGRIDGSYNLANLNDSGATFAQIADIIEKYL